MDVYRLPALFDNYVFLLHDSQDNIAAVVDPAEVQPLLQRLRELDAQLVAIFNTHHHSDHVGGNRELIHHFLMLSSMEVLRIAVEFLDKRFFYKKGIRLSFAIAPLRFSLFPDIRGHILPIIFLQFRTGNQVNYSVAILYLQGVAADFLKVHPHLW